VGLGVNPVKIAAIAVEVVLVDVGWAVEAMSYTENGSAAPEQKGTDVDFVAAKSVAVAVVVADVAEEEEPVVVVAAAAAAAAAAAGGGGDDDDDRDKDNSGHFKAPFNAG